MEGMLTRYIYNVWSPAPAVRLSPVSPLSVSGTSARCSDSGPGPGLHPPLSRLVTSRNIARR